MVNLLHCTFCGTPLERIMAVRMPPLPGSIGFPAIVVMCRDCSLTNTAPQIVEKFHGAIRNELKLTPFEQSPSFNVPPEQEQADEHTDTSE